MAGVCEGDCLVSCDEVGVVGLDGLKDLLVACWVRREGEGWRHHLVVCLQVADGKHSGSSDGVFRVKGRRDIRKRYCHFDIFFLKVSRNNDDTAYSYFQREMRLAPGVAECRQLAAYNSRRRGVH